MAEPRSKENGNLSMRENLVMTSATGREALSRLCRGGGGESQTCSLRLSWRNVSQFA